MTGPDIVANPFVLVSRKKKMFVVYLGHGTVRVRRVTVSFSPYQIETFF